MKKLKQIGYVHFYVPDGADDIFSIISETCNGIEQYVSAIRCERNYGEIEFKYSPYVSHYSIKCGFNNHHLLLMDTYHPSNHVKFSGIATIDSQRYDYALYEEQMILPLYNKIHSHIQIAFLNINNKK